MSKSHIAVSHCFAMPLFASHPWLCTLQLLDSSCSPGGSCRWSCHSGGHRPDRTRPHPGKGPPLGKMTDIGRRRKGRTWNNRLSLTLTLVLSHQHHIPRALTDESHPQVFTVMRAASVVDLTLILICRQKLLNCNHYLLPFSNMQNPENEPSLMLHH